MNRKRGKREKFGKHPGKTCWRENISAKKVSEREEGQRGKKGLQKKHLQTSNGQRLSSRFWGVGKSGGRGHGKEKSRSKKKDKGDRRKRGGEK